MPAAHPTLADDVATFAERSLATFTQHQGRCALIANKGAVPEHWELEALRGAMVAASDAQHRGAVLADRVAQAVENLGREAGVSVEVHTALTAAGATMAQALNRYRVVTEGSRNMLRNAGPAAVYADA